MSVRVMSAVWDNGPLNYIDRYVLLCIADAANEDGYGYPSVDKMGQKTQLSKRTILRSLQSLEGDGWIVVNRKSRKVKFSTYEVVLDRFKLSGDSKSPEKRKKSGDSHDTSQVTNRHKSGDSQSTGPHTPNIEEPPINHHSHPSEKSTCEKFAKLCFLKYPKQRSPVSGKRAFFECVNSLVKSKRFNTHEEAGKWLLDRVILFAESSSVLNSNPRYISRADRWVKEGRYDEDAAMWMTTPLSTAQNVSFEEERAQLLRVI